MNFLRLSFPALLALLLLSLPSPTLAQWQGGRPGGGAPAGGFSMKGRLYGKIVDENGAGVSYAAVQVWSVSRDSSGQVTEKLVTGQLSEANGDFSLSDIPVQGRYELRISLLGYAATTQPVSFMTPGGGRPNLDKDVGNIVLQPKETVLDEVVIEAEGTSVTLALDKKIFRVDRNATATGGTAVDALKNVPSLSVDFDGNLTLRNAAPQIFVDGRPTTLTLDQIPADIIESVEVITNPSAKFDAGGGQAGIVNIVLKKDRRIGYYGGVRAGIDTRGGFNSGGDVNIREGNVNTFISANLNQFVNQGAGQTTRQNFFGTPTTDLFQTDTSRFRGQFANLRAGVDWFVNNRNTLTFSGSFTRGQFRPNNQLYTRTDSLFADRTPFSESIRLSESERMFQNLGASILFKHLFPKDGMEWTADINYNRIQSGGEGNFETAFLGTGFSSREQQLSDGGTNFITAQTDFVNPLTDQIKLELGARAAIRRFDNNTYNYLFDEGVGDFRYIPTFFDEYQYTDAVYAAYGTFSHQFPKWGYQAGLRIESSQYDGVLPLTGETFDNDFPFSVFPSLFVTRKLGEEDNLQFSYSRRINRPNFFQLMPFIDFSDSLNLRRGNPDLLPEFTNSFEVTYQNILSKGHDILVSAYYKQASNLITSYQFTEYVEQFGREVVMASYANSAQSLAYGVEFTMRNTFLEIFELTSNVNLYNSRVDASNVEVGLVNEQFTWFIKENLNVRLPGDIRLQLIGEYQSRTAFSMGGGGRFGGWRGVSNTAQGYTLPNWFLDVALRKDFFKRKLNLTVAMQDVFRSRINGSYSESAFFIQETSSLRNPQLVRVNLSYRFGKPDMSLFKRKNNRVNMEGMDMM